MGETTTSAAEETKKNEVTPAMIDAGVTALNLWYGNEAGEPRAFREQAVSEVFDAMQRVKADRSGVVS